MNIFLLSRSAHVLIHFYWAILFLMIYISLFPYLMKWKLKYATQISLPLWVTLLTYGPSAARPGSTAMFAQLRCLPRATTSQ